MAEEPTIALDILFKVIGLISVVFVILGFVVTQWRASSKTASIQAALDAEQNSDMKSIKISYEAAWVQIHELRTSHRELVDMTADLSKNIALLQLEQTHMKDDMAYTMKTNERTLDALTTMYSK